MANYEQAPPNLVTVILEAHGFNQLVERVNFMHRIAEQNAHDGRLDAHHARGGRASGAACSHHSSIATRR